MNLTNSHKVLLLGGVLLVYIFAHWNEVRSQYVINDDVRQQIYWMQQWQDPELFQDHYLTEYAKQYVPWGVKAIYQGAAYFINPVQFSKVLGAILFLMTAYSLFLLASRLGDELTGVITVCVFLYFGFFLGSVSGGLSRGFVFPLLLLYLFFLSGKELFRAGWIIAVQALFNPYLCLLCLVTHGLFLLHTETIGYFSGSQNLLAANVNGIKGKQSHNSKTRLLLLLLPLCVAVLLLVAKYRVFAVPDFGKIVSYAEMVGHIEYTAAGRYEIIPVPSIFFEFIRPFIQYLPRGVLSVVASVAGTVLLVAFVLSGWNTRAICQRLKKLNVFLYLLLASVFLYYLSRFFLMNLFLPSRYLEYSLTVFYCVLAGLLLRSGMEFRGVAKNRTILVMVLLVLFGVIRLFGVGIYDYAAQSSLYQFLQTTPKNCVVAGHPDSMDNIMTFARRKVFVSYELSHTWYDLYWSILKDRTYQFFDAYYSDNPDDIKTFCRKNTIDFIVVRESDFVGNAPNGTAAYFEPFGKYIQQLMEETDSYAILDEKIFTPVYSQNGIRVLAFTRSNEQ